MPDLHLCNREADAHHQVDAVSKRNRQLVSSFFAGGDALDVMDPDSLSVGATDAVSSFVFGEILG